MKTENFPRRDTLYRPDHFLQGVPRNTLCQKMDMVPVKADLQKMNLVTLPDLKTNPLEGLRNGTAQNFSPIFDTAHKMVQKQAFVMALGIRPLMTTNIAISVRDTRGKPSGNSND